MIKKTLCLSILLLISIKFFAQTPFIRNYTPDEYKAYNQNWAMVQDQRGIMYFGNKYGVLEYDGINWRTIATPGTVYSLCMDKSGCIYVGLNGDFGYLQADSCGSLQYKSLKDKIPEEHKDFKKVWDINSVGEKIILRTHYKLLVYQNDSLSVLINDKKIWPAGVVQGKYYISVKEKGLMYLEGDSLLQMPETELFTKIDIKVILPYGEDEILLVTGENGIQIYNPKKSPSIRIPDGFNTVSEFLNKNIADYSGVKLSNGHFAIGTKVGGILVFDKKGKIHKHYHKQNGLQSNKIHYLFTDLNGQLWASLENGISLIANNLPFVNYTGKDGLDGSVYSIQKFKDKLYVGTSNNLYVQNKENKFESIEGTIGKNLILLQAKGKLLLGNSLKGIFDIKDNQAFQQSELLKITTRKTLRLRKFPNYILTHAKDKGLILIEYKNEQWIFKHIIKGFDKDVRFYVEDDNGNFWASANNQLYKFRLNKTLDSVMFLQHYPAKQYHLPETSLTPYRLIDGEIIFNTKKGIYRYLTDENYFEPHPDFPMFTEGISKLKQDASGNIWFEELKKGNIFEKGVLRSINGRYEIVKTPFLKFKDRSITNSYAFYPYSDSLVYFGTAKGLFEYHPKQIVNYDIPFNTLIREIFVNDSLFYGGSANSSSLISDDPEILKYKDNNLFFHYSATFYEDSEKNLFSYRLIGSSDTTWSGWTIDHKKEYTNLHEGKYIFEVKSQNIYRKYGNKAAFTFEILPPWQRTGLAYALYAILAIVFVWIVIRLNSVRLKRQNELLKQTVIERTADISNQKEKLQIQAEELKASNDELNMLNSTKDKFFSIIAHDLRSPFNSILGFSELLIENLKDFEIAESEKYVGFINSSAQNTLILLDNLLNWAKSQTGQIKLNPKEISLSLIIGEIIEQSNSVAIAKEISLIHKQTDEIEVYADEDILKTVLRNLISNAIKFTKTGGCINIVVNTEQNYVEISISDNGIGINEEKLRTLFDISSNTTSPGTANEMGSGLGLVLCKEFVEKLGGSIWVESEEEIGSNFKFTLPLNK